MATRLTALRFQAWHPSAGPHAIPLAFGRLHTYMAGTQAPLPTYKDEAMSIVNPNPIILDGAGQATIVLDGNYKFVLEDEEGVPVETIDNVSSDDSSELLSAIVQNTIVTYMDHATMLGDTTQPAPTFARVVNDGDEENNGYWIWNGSSWSRAALQPASDAALATLTVRVSALEAQDLGNLKTAAFRDVPEAGDALEDEVVLGDDSRLSDQREPTAHQHEVDDIQDWSDIGKALAKAVDQDEAKQIIGAGDSDLELGYEAGKAMPGDAGPDDIGAATAVQGDKADDAYGWGDHAQANYLTQHQSLAGLATEQWVQQQGYKTVDTTYTAGSGLDLSGDEFSVKFGSGAGEVMPGNTAIPTLPAVVDKNEAEAGAAQTARLWTAERVKQAIDALAPQPGGGGTVTSVGLTAPAGLEVTGGPVTASGTLMLSYEAGYSIPSSARQGQWDTAYGWGDHADANYLTQHQSLAGYATENWVQSQGYVKNSGAESIAGAKTFTDRLAAAGAYTPSKAVAYAASITLDCAESNVFEVGELEGDVDTITLANPEPGQAINVRFVQDATGGHLVAAPAGAAIEGQMPDMPGAYAWLMLIYVDAASRWEGYWSTVDTGAAGELVTKGVLKEFTAADNIVRGGATTTNSSDTTNWARFNAPIECHGDFVVRARPREDWGVLVHEYETEPTLPSGPAPTPSGDVPGWPVRRGHHDGWLSISIRKSDFTAITTGDLDGLTLEYVVDDGSGRIERTPHMVVLGDSISSFGGVSPVPVHYPSGSVSRVDQLWWHQVARALSIPTQTVLAINGASVTNYNDGDSVVEQVAGIPATASDIFVFGGINDFNNGDAGVTMPDHTQSYDTGTFEGAICQVIKDIVTAHPQARVYLMSPAQMEVTWPDVFGITLNDVANFYREVAQMFGVRFISTTQCGISPFNVDHTTDDGLHPSVFGQAMIAHTVLGAIA